MRRKRRVGLNVIINLCLALRQWAGWRKRKEGFKLRPTYAARILSNGSCPKSGLIRQENGFREHSARAQSDSIFPHSYSAARNISTRLRQSSRLTLELLTKALVYGGKSKRLDLFPKNIPIDALRKKVLLI